MKKSFKYSQLLKDVQCIGACSIFALAFSPSVLAQENSESDNPTEEVIVYGVKQSIQDALSMKRDASQIIDAISAEDIGKLPDDNIAEALQRVTGISIQRDEAGEGSGFQIRGISDNQVTMNGQSLASDTFDERVNSFSALDSALVKSIEVLKTARADQIEGGIGGTISLKTRKALDFADRTIQAKVELNDNSLESNLGSAISAFATDSWDVGNGEFGVLFNVSYSNRNRVTEGFNAGWDGIDLRNVDQILKAENAHPGHPTFFMKNANIAKKYFEIENSTADLSLQWAPNEDLMLYFDGRVSEKDQWKAESKLAVQFFGTGNNATGRNLHLLPGYQLSTHSYAPSGNEFINASQPITDKQEPAMDGDRIRAYLAADNLASVDPNFVLQRSFVTQGTFYNDDQRENQRSTINPNANLENELTDQTSFSLGGEWQITDALVMEAKYASSTAIRDIEKWNVALDIEYRTPDDRLMYPSVTYDLNQGTDLPGIEFSLLDPMDRTISYASDFNITDAAQRNDVHRLRNLDRNLEPMEITTDEFTADFDWDVDYGFITKIQFGARWNKENKFKDFFKMITPFKPDTFVDNDNDGIPDDTNMDGKPDFQNREKNPSATVGEIIRGESENPESYLTAELADRWFEKRSGMSTVSGDFPREYWAATDDPGVWNEFISAVYGGQQFVRDDTRHEEITEETSAIYFMFDFESEVADRRLVGNFGIRWFETKVNSEAYLSRNFVPWYLGELGVIREDGKEISGGEYALRYQAIYGDNTYPLGANLTIDTRGEDVSGTFDLVGKDYTWFATKYDEILPSLNLSYELTEDMYLRLGLSQTIARPRTNDIIIDPARLGPDDFRQGNPDLKPFTSDNLDLSYEWYINETDAFSLAYFHKDLGGQLTQSTSFNEILDGYIRIPQNGGSAKIKGFEIAYTDFFDFLPEAWQGFGVQLNYTSTDSEQETDVNDFGGGAKPALDLSDSSYNFILFYENYGFSVRVAYNWRDSFLSGEDSNFQDAAAPNGQGTFQIDQDLSSAIGRAAYIPYSLNPNRWTQSRSQLDISVDYRVNDMIKIFAQANNATEEANIATLDDPKAIKSYNLPSTFYRFGVQIKL